MANTQLRFSLLFCALINPKYDFKQAFGASLCFGDCDGMYFRRLRPMQID